MPDPYKTIGNVIEAARNAILRIGFRGFYRQAHLPLWSKWGGRNGRFLLEEESQKYWGRLAIAKFKIFGPWGLILSYLKCHYNYSQKSYFHIFSNKRDIQTVCLDTNDMTLLVNIKYIEDPYLGELVNQHQQNEISSI